MHLPGSRTSAPGLLKPRSFSENRWMPIVVRKTWLTWLLLMHCDGFLAFATQGIQCNASWQIYNQGSLFRFPEGCVKSGYQNKAMTHTDRRRRDKPCKDCKGEGRIKGEVCQNCHGTGDARAPYRTK